MCTQLVGDTRLTYTEHPSVSCIDVQYQGALKHWLVMDCEEETMQILVAVSGAAGEGAATVTVHVTRCAAGREAAWSGCRGYITRGFHGIIKQA